MSHNFTVLFVEDDSTDRLLIARAFKNAQLAASAKFVEDGWQLKDYLTGDEGFGNRRLHPMPNIIVTDLRMPGFSGIELLRWIKSSEQFRSIPVFILSAYMFEEDFRRAKEFGVEMYLSKPLDPRELTAIFRSCLGPYTARHKLERESYPYLLGEPVLSS